MLFVPFACDALFLVERGIAKSKEANRAANVAQLLSDVMASRCLLTAKCTSFKAVTKGCRVGRGFWHLSAGREAS